MNRVFSPFVNSLFLALMSVCSMTAAAGAPSAADAVKGAALYADGDAARNIPACVSCHGAAGNSTIAANPKLAAQFAPYLYKQLVDFTTPQRNQAIMSTYAKLLSDADKRNIAAYLAAQTPKPGAAKDPATLELGKKIFRGGIAEKSVPACAGCHGPAGNGVPNQYPRLAGQHQDYTAAQLSLFRQGARSNSAPMTVIAKRLSDDEIKAVADYVAGLK